MLSKRQSNCISTNLCLADFQQNGLGCIVVQTIARKFCFYLHLDEKYVVFFSRVVDSRTHTMQTATTTTTTATVLTAHCLMNSLKVETRNGICFSSFRECSEMISMISILSLSLTLRLSSPLFHCSYEMHLMPVNSGEFNFSHTHMNSIEQ